MTASPTTYGLLGMLAVRSYTGYELTHQLRRSIRFVWSSSEGHLYREQRRLVELGWASAHEESTGGRTRKRYEITPAGEEALAAWLGSEARPPQFEVEGLLRLFHGSFAEPADLVATLESTAAEATAMCDELTGYAAEYLEPGGPVDLLQGGEGGPGERVEWRGRTVYPERLHVIAMVIDGTTRMLEALATFASGAAAEIRGWDSTTEGSPDATRARLEAVVSRRRSEP